MDHFDPTAAAGQPATTAPTEALIYIPHPTVSAPKCADCAHHTQAPVGHNPRAHACAHPVVARSLVTGHPTQLCADMRNDGPAGYMPAPGAVSQRCGAEGRLFAAQPVKNIAFLSGESQPLQPGDEDRRFTVENPGDLNTWSARRWVDAAESELKAARLRKVTPPPSLRRRVKDPNGTVRWAYPSIEEAQAQLLRARNQLAESLVAARREGAPCAHPDQQAHASVPDPDLAPGMVSDFVMLRTYQEWPDGTSTEFITELVDALKPAVAERIANGGAFQLTFWGQGGRPKAVPQAGEPLQPLGTSAAASGNGPEPYSRTTSTESCTDLPATAQA